MRYIIPILFALLVSGCFRTHYENFSPANPNRGPQPAQRARASGWQHFFIYGLVPDELSVDARSMCGRAENVDFIETRRTFAEGLVAAFAGYYINIYSPFDGAVYCKVDPRTLPQQPVTTQPSPTP